MSSLESEVDAFDGGQTSGGHNRRESVGECLPPDHEFAHLTKLRSEPTESTHMAARARKMPVPTLKMLLAREANYSGRGRFSLSDFSHVLGQYLPVKGPWCVDRMESRAYTSQFSADGSLFIVGYQDNLIRIYDVDNGWRVHKDIIARSLHWTITDTALSPDQRYLVYASITPTVHIVNVGTAARESHANITDIHEVLDFSIDDNTEYSFGIFSVNFSKDGHELVAGSNDDSIYVYDLEANQLTSSFKAHASDVNIVTFADETGNLIYSGSDDTLCKVWDRRCFLAREKEAGVLTGHLEGITFLDSRGDGRYFISNGKDQTTKLWDIRKMTSKANRFRRRIRHWDYRYMKYPSKAKHKHPCDLSLATYRGHSVLQTLIRCYFSPAYSTGQKYIYTGSNDRCIYIYDVVSGNQVAKLAFHSSTVRDCSWHPYYPMLVTSSWDGLVVRWESSRNEPDPSLVKKRSRRRRIN